MISTQKHIIHQVIVDVETKNERVAFQLKDTIDVFLKEEIFPSLEDYFESLEDEFQTQTIQISKLELTINSTSENDLKELKEDIKKQAFKELKKVIKSPKAESENITFLSTAKNDERGLIYFLEKGTPPWWNGSDESDFLKEKKLIEICRSTSFIKSFREKIAKENVQDRLINQFLDEEIQTLFENTFHIDAVEKSIISNEIIKQFEALIPSVRKSIWKMYIDYFLNKNEIGFLEKLVELARLVKTNKNQKNTIKKLTEIIELISQKFDKKASRKILQEYLHSEQNSLKGNDENTIGFDSKNSIENNKEKLTKSNIDIDATIGTKIDVVIDEKSTIGFVESKTVNEEDKALSFDSKKAKENIDFNEDSHNEHAAESLPVSDDLGSVEVKSSHDENEILYAGNENFKSERDVEKFDDLLSRSEYDELQGKEHKKTVSEDLKPIENEQKKLEESTSELKLEKQNEKVVSKDLKTDEVSERKKTSFEDKKSHKNTSNLLSSSEKETQQKKSAFEELKTIENAQEKSRENTSELEHKKQRNEVVSEELETDEISKRNKASFKDKKSIENTTYLLSKPEKETQGNASTFEELKNIESIQETSKENISKLDANSDKNEEIITGFSENEFFKQEIYPEEKGEYYIQNAGLILLHPYLKDFFSNCDLLSDDSKITDPELAIHLLHYMATKKEKQFENKMVFEKFLCGVPIQKTIRRNIEISDELKQKSEELLEAVISNWTSLNNASPDLLRNEFLQRSGKISFKDTNPKVVVERKVYDILLDKIPWTLSICKLPWNSKLIFTDW